jgi:hypothetical protein
MSEIVKAHPEGIKGEVFALLHQNLCAIKTEYVGREAVLCPICLREITKAEILATGFEHIVPQAQTKTDPAELAMNLTKTQRSGATILCRQSRTLQDGTDAKDGCNGFKGSRYDWSLRGMLGPEPIDRKRLSNVHFVAVVTMAYLGAFQNFGYGYILRPELDPIREQFGFPNEKKTDWLDKVAIHTGANAPQIIMTTGANSFTFFGQTVEGAPLGVRFRKFVAWLPNGVWPTNTLGVPAVGPLLSLLPRLSEEVETEAPAEIATDGTRTGAEPE